VTGSVTPSASPEDIVDHRERIAFEVDIILQGYWSAPIDPMMRGAIYADWCDELERWSVEAVRWALREHRRKHPGTKPNPGHIWNILDGEDRRRRAKLKIRPPRDMTPERREPRASPEAVRRILGRVLHGKGRTDGSRPDSETSGEDAGDGDKDDPEPSGTGA
jgi:hypothetical protein